MIDIRPLELRDRASVGDFLRRYPPQVSELTFTNLFVWRHSRPVFVAEMEGAMVFLTKGGGDSGRAFILGHPLGEASPLSLAERLGDEVAAFTRIPEGTAGLLEEAGLKVVPDRDNADYVDDASPLSQRPLVESAVASALPLVRDRLRAQPDSRPLAQVVKDGYYLQSRLAGGCE